MSLFRWRCLQFASARPALAGAARPRGIAAWRLALTCCAVACKSDMVCVETCVSPGVAEINVSATNAPLGPVGLTMTVVGPAILDQSGCSGGVTFGDECGITGGPGSYQVTLNAPGYQPAIVNFDAPAPSKPDACGCQDFHLQTFSVVMQPVTD